MPRVIRSLTIEIAQGVSESIMTIMLRIAARQWVKWWDDDIIKCFVIMNVWYYSYAFVSILGIYYAAANCMLKSLTNNQVNMRMCKNQIM